MTMSGMKNRGRVQKPDDYPPYGPDPMADGTRERALPSCAGTQERTAGQTVGVSPNSSERSS